MAVLALTLCLHAADPAVEVTLVDGATRTGRVVVAGARGGVLLETPDGALHALAADRVARRRLTGGRFEPWPPRRTGEELLAELGRGARLTVTPHFVIASTATPAATGEVADLLEEVQAGFRAAFGGDAPLPRPRRALPVLVFGDRAAFEAYASDATRFGGTAPAGSRGFYDPVSNRVALFEPGEDDPDPPDLGTVAHEATHQLAYNCGLHARLADNPMWLTEGVATLAESTGRGRRRPGVWRGFDARPAARAAEFRRFLAARDADPSLRDTNPLEKLIGTDALFLDARTARGAYAVAWALTDMLRRRAPAAFAAYLRELSDLPPLAQGSVAGRLATFRRHFGTDLDAIWRTMRSRR